MKLGLTSTCGVLTAASCISTFIAAVLHVVAFSTRRWIVSVENSPFVSIGYFEACFDDCRDPYCPASGSVDVIYTGCSPMWTWNYYFQEIWTWLLPDWFVTCRTLAAVNVPLIFLTFILMAICTALAFKGRYSTESNQEKVATALQIMLFICAVMILTAVIISMILMTSLYTHGFERAWMPMPEKNAFGWSFWLEFSSTIIMVSAFLCTIYAAVVKTIWLHGDIDPRYSEDMMRSRAAPSPAPGVSGLGQALQRLPHRTV